MIVDRLENLKRYQFPRTEDILKFIANNDCINLPNGQIDIDGKELFVRVMEYEPKPASDNRFETHQKYADLQFVALGIELMQIAPSKSLMAVTEYDAEGDYHFFKADKNITELVVEAGQFTVFYPGEAHRPSCLYQNNKNKVKKLVFKIRMK